MYGGDCEGTRGRFRFSESTTGNSSLVPLTRVFVMFNRLTVAVPLSWQKIFSNRRMGDRLDFAPSSCLPGSNPAAPLINGDGDGRQHGGRGCSGGGGRLLGRAGEEME